MIYYSENSLLTLWVPEDQAKAITEILFKANIAYWQPKSGQHSNTYGGTADFIPDSYEILANHPDHQPIMIFGADFTRDRYDDGEVYYNYAGIGSIDSLRSYAPGLCLFPMEDTYKLEDIHFLLVPEVKYARISAGRLNQNMEFIRLAPLLAIDDAEDDKPLALWTENNQIEAVLNCLRERNIDYTLDTDFSAPLQLDERFRFKAELLSSHSYRRILAEPERTLTHRIFIHTDGDGNKIEDKYDLIQVAPEFFGAVETSLLRAKEQPEKGSFRDKLAQEYGDIKEGGGRRTMAWLGDRLRGGRGG